MEDNGFDIADFPHNPGYRLDEVSGVHPPHPVAGHGRIGQRAGDIEDGAETYLGEDSGECLGVDPGAHAVKDADSGLLYAVLNSLGVALNVNPYRLQDVDCAAGRGEGSGAVLGHADASGGGDYSGGGADVKGLKRVHAGAAVFHQGLGYSRCGLYRINLVDSLPGPGDFLGGLPLGGQRCQEGPLLQVRLLVKQHLAEHLSRLRAA